MSDLPREVFVCEAVETTALREAERSQPVSERLTESEEKRRGDVTPDKIAFVVRWLELASKYDKTDDFWWRCDNEYAPVTIFVNCNDLFYWATADSEELNADNIDSYEQCLKDADAAMEFGHCYADAIWCCRQRGMRPQGACYKHYPEALWPLFDACGPERETDRGPFGNPKPQPKGADHA